MNTKQLLTKLQFRESFLTELTSDTSYYNKITLTQIYKEKYVNPLVGYFEVKFKSIGATFLFSKSLKSVALFDIDYPNYGNLSEKERQHVRIKCIDNFTIQLPKTKKREGLFAYSSDRVYGVMTPVSEIEIYAPSKTTSLILKEFKATHKKLFVVGIGDNQNNNGIRLYIMFNSLASSFSYLMENSIWYSHKTRRILADLTEDDFEEFYQEMKRIIDNIVRAIRFIEV